MLGLFNIFDLFLSPWIWIPNPLMWIPNLLMWIGPDPVSNTE